MAGSIKVPQRKMNEAINFFFNIFVNSFFQAAIIARKKESTAEKLNDARNELSATEEEISEKRQQVQSFAGETVLRGDDFKRYVASLRGKSNTYKKKRAELSEYRAEFGVLSRTLELIQGKNERLQQSLSRYVFFFKYLTIG